MVFFAFLLDKRVGNIILTNLNILKYNLALLNTTSLNISIPTAHQQAPSTVPYPMPGLYPLLFGSYTSDYTFQLSQAQILSMRFKTKVRTPISLSLWEATYAPTVPLASKKTNSPQILVSLLMTERTSYIFHFRL